MTVTRLTVVNSLRSKMTSPFQVMRSFPSKSNCPNDLRAGIGEAVTKYLGVTDSGLTGLHRWLQQSLSLLPHTYHCIRVGLVFSSLSNLLPIWLYVDSRGFFLFSHCFSFISGYDDKLPWQSYSKKESECTDAFALAGAYLLLALMQSGVQFLKWCCSRSGWGLPTSTSLKPIKKIPQRHANRPTQARQVLIETLIPSDYGLIQVNN